jgi:hypothetical protein
VSVVVKYADNILKGFAASFSIVTSFILCVFIFDFVPTYGFVFGAVSDSLCYRYVCICNICMYLTSFLSFQLLVNVSMVMYSYKGNV